MQKHNWLITGGAGFIGSHITERLLKEGHNVRVLDNFSTGKEENLSFASVILSEAKDPNTPSLRGSASDRGNPSTDPTPSLRESEATAATPNFTLIKGDIRDKSTCEKACENIDYISHQAALRSVPKSLESPHDYNAVNIDGSLNILESALKAKVKRVVIASSSSIYGDTTSFPQKETDTPLLISPYALSKLTVEYYSRIFSQIHGLETVNLRYFNVFGPRQALDDEYAVVIPKFITSILNNEQPPIFGTGEQSRDFTYIDNVVEANILACLCEGAPDAVFASEQSERGNPSTDTRRLCEGAPATAAIPARTFSEVINVANGKDTTVLALVDSINKITNKTIKPKLLPIRKGDVFKTLADTKKLKTILRFKPKVDFEEGLRRTVEYFRSVQHRLCERTK